MGRCALRCVGDVREGKRGLVVFSDNFWGSSMSITMGLITLRGCVNSIPNDEGSSLM